MVQQLGYTLGSPEFEVQYEEEMLLFSKSFRTALRPTHPPIQWVQAFFSKGKVPES